jgi:hypothetical protein
MIQKIEITKVKENPSNPRFIRDDKFDKLVQSIKSFPQMLDLRPIVVNEDMVVLGGNMRLKACIAAGLTQVAIIKASELTEEQQKEFVIKDNSSFGEWDWDVLVNEWPVDDLSDWGLDIPKSYFDDDVEPQFDTSDLGNKLDSYINAKIKQVVLYFDTQQYEDVVNFLDGICKQEDLESNTEAFIFLMENYRANN